MVFDVGFDVGAFEDWMNAYVVGQGGNLPPQTWVAIDPNNVVVGRNANCNDLMDQLKSRGDFAVLRFVYTFPAEWV